MFLRLLSILVCFESSLTFRMPGSFDPDLWTPHWGTTHLYSCRVTCLGEVTDPTAWAKWHATSSVSNCTRLKSQVWSQVTAPGAHIGGTNHRSVPLVESFSQGGWALVQRLLPCITRSHLEGHCWVMTFDFMFTFFFDTAIAHKKKKKHMLRRSSDLLRCPADDTFCFTSLAATRLPCESFHGETFEE